MRYLEAGAVDTLVVYEDLQMRKEGEDVLLTEHLVAAIKITDVHLV
jgi:peptide subunit release factor 1 (eRF1)